MCGGGAPGGPACRRALDSTDPSPVGKALTGQCKARVPCRGPRAIRNRGGDPRFRTVRAELGVVSAPPPSG